MNLPAWQEEAWERLVARARRDALPHGLLLAGPPGIGKRAFAERLAAFLLCEDAAAAPCGRCRSCRLFAVRSQREPEETRPDGSLSHPDGYAGHPDARFVGHAWNERGKKMYGEIVVDQIRELSAWLALTSQFGRAQVVLIDPADALNAAAANALLKTLEEPSAARYLMLVSAHPARLPATIRSRCQRVDFALPPAAQSLAWLQGNGLDAAAAATALEASGGNPGLALSWSRNGRVGLRDQVATQLRALHSGRASPLEVANAWTRAEPDACLWFAASLVHAEAGAIARGERGPLALTGAADLTKLSVWFDQAGRTRDLLRGPVRAELLLLDLLVEWKALGAPSNPRAA